MVIDSLKAIRPEVIKELDKWGIELIIVDRLPSGDIIELSRAPFDSRSAVLYPNKIVMSTGMLKHPVINYFVIHEMIHLVNGCHTSTYIDEIDAGIMGLESCTHKIIGMPSQRWFEYWTMDCGRDRKRCHDGYRMWHKHKRECRERRLQDSLRRARQLGMLDKDNRIQYKLIK